MAQQEQKQEKFDLESVYDEQIFPLMKQVIDICKEHKMPLLVSVNYANREEDAEQPGQSFCTTLMTFEGRTPQTLVSATQLIRKGFTAFAITRKGD